MAEHCLEIKTYSFSHAIFSAPGCAAQQQLQGYSCHLSSPTSMRESCSPARRHQQGRCCPMFPAGCHCPCCTRRCTHVFPCVPAQPGTLPLCAGWVRTAGHYLFLPLHTAMGGREVSSVLDMGLTRTMITSICAISYSLEKEGK